MLKIITGRISSSKTHILIEEIGKRIESRQKSILIVPDPVTYNFEQRLCSQLNINGFIDVEVCSFNRLASSIVDFFGKNKKSYLDDSAKTMAMRFCILNCKDKLTIFKSTSDKKGFSALALKMISTLENCGYSVDDLNNVIQKLDNGILKYKLMDMAVLYQEYNKILSSGYTDNADKLKTAQQLLPVYSRIKNTVIYIDGFDVFTTSLYNFIGSLMEQTDIVIALSCAENNSDSTAYEIHQITLDNLIKIAKERNVPFKIEHTKRNTNHKSDEIHFIEDNFYKTKPFAFTKDTKNIFLNYYLSPQDEIEMVARSIFDGVKKGNRFKDYALLCNDLDKYSPLVNTIFARYNIPVHTNKKYDIAAHPVSMYLFALLKCAYSGFTPENILNLALSSLTSLQQDEKEIFVSFIKEMGVKGYEIENGLYFDRGDTEKQTQFDIIRKSFVAPIKEFRKNILQKNTATEMASCCYDFLKEQGIYEKTQNLVDQYEEMGFFELSDITAQLWNKTQALLEEVAQLFGSTPISVEEFSKTLHEGFVSSNASTIPSVLDCVTFGELTSAKEQEISYVFIVGANDGIIPKTYSDERIVTASESALLIDLGLELTHSVETEDARLRYNIYSAICTPTKALSFSCPLFNQNGSPLSPSPIFKRFLQLFPELRITNNVSLTPRDNLKKIYSIEQAMHFMALDRLNSPESVALSKYFDSFNNRKYDILKQQKKSKETVLPKDIASKLFLHKNSTSISRLETFATCPYKHFIEYGLSPVKSKEYNTDSLDIGTMIHTTLEIFTKENAFNELTRQECYDKTSEIFDKIVPDVHFGAMISTNRQKAFNKILKDLTSESAWKIKEHLKGFSVIGQEISFGYNKFPPIEIDTEYGKLYIKGKIDRADSLEKDGSVYLRIVDYKSGDKKFNAYNVENGTDIQLMIYMDALLSHFKNSKPASAQYMLIAKDNELSGPVNNAVCDDKKALSEDVFYELIDTSKKTAVKLAQDILSGNIMPAECDNCAYCDYNGICGIKNIDKEEN
ncbi:MAG: hypothetical protein E7365_04190 [Clostridiales bacterium]|nr:hypothetical protein [Clostridiales bacterium]